MIKIDKVHVFGFEGAVRGMRMPYESGLKSDSTYCEITYPVCSECPVFKDYKSGNSFCVANVFSNAGKVVIGKADMTLAKKLIKAGSEHRKFLRMIHVQADVIAPRYWWAEMDKYKYVEANSSSTMHLITKRELTDDDFSIDYRDNKLPSEWTRTVIDNLNDAIREYQKDKDKGCSKDILDIDFRIIKQILPESYNQVRTIDTNYEALLSIYHQRKNHKLIEWSGENGFCQWIINLPYMSEFLEDFA